MRILHATILALFVAAGATGAAAAEALPGEVLLETDLKTSSLAVFVRAPLGFRYRPGYALPLQFRIQNHGPKFNGELIIAEGESGSALRSVVRFDAESNQSFTFTVPVRAPRVSANLFATIRGGDEGGSLIQLPRFRARLSSLTPLAPEARVVLSVGKTGHNLKPGDYSEVVKTYARDLPERDWIYESVDLVVLTDNSLKDARPAAKECLKRYILGGGRLFISSDEALKESIGAGLLPGVSEANPARSWWEKNAGLREADVLAEKDHRPVFCKRDLGFGVIVFVFPLSPQQHIIEKGPAIFNHPALQRERDKAAADLRVQEQRYDAFNFGGVNAERSGRAILFLGVGALFFCVILILCFNARSRWEAAGLPVCLAALLAVMLAHWFPTPQLAVSRIVWSKHAADGAAENWTEWKLIETFRDPGTIAAAGPSVGSLLPIYCNEQELRSSDGEMVQSSDALRLEKLTVYANRQLLLQGSATIAATPQPAAFSCATEPLELALPSAPAATLQRRKAVWARSDGTLMALDSLNAPQGFSMRRYDTAVSALRESLRSGSDETRKAQAAALNWATASAIRSKRDVLVMWGEAGEDAVKSLVEVEPSNYEVASTLLISSFEIKVKEVTGGK
jgi:hypothetical protein